MILSNWVNLKYLSEGKLKPYPTDFSNHKPFPNLELNSFIKEERIIDLLQALSQEQFSPHHSDLFQFSQTFDLLHSNNLILKDFVSLLSSAEILDFMQRTTKLKLNGRIDLFGSIYQDTDYLLPHDDQVPGRKIAFMLYLNDLEEKDGGALVLYQSKNKTARDVAKRIVPAAGTIVFFEVSPLSVHRVEEVLTDTQRITLSGWFYG